MEQLVAKYVGKMVEQRIADDGMPVLGCRDSDIVWSRSDPKVTRVLEDVFEQLNINSLLYCRPAEPYGSMIEYLAAHSDGAIFPRDTETRTFLHDLPLAESFTVEELVHNLKKRKTVILPGGEIVSFGTISPQQAFIGFSSVCFACFVKFMSDRLLDSRGTKMDDHARRIMDDAVSKSEISLAHEKTSHGEPYTTEDDVHREMARVGRLTVKNGMVDSYFGNISYLMDDILYISQTGSSLDELEGTIDPYPLDGSSCAGITASSELTAHLQILEATGQRAILHGHPKFSVIVSLDCRVEDCDGAGRCHLECPETRTIGDVPIVAGEVGTGRYGLCNTVPGAMVKRRGVIVYGHGVFTVGRTDLDEPLNNLLDIERMCLEEFVRLTGY